MWAGQQPRLLDRAGMVPAKATTTSPTGGPAPLCAACALAGRHNTDVDEGVDALLSLASGAHPSAAPLDEGHRAPGLEAGSTAEPDLEGLHHHPHADLHEHLAVAGLGGAQGGTPRRGGGGGGGGRTGRSGAGRATPTATPTGTPVKGGRGAAAAAEMLPVAAAATGLRSPRARGGAGGVGSPLAGGRGGGSLVPGSASKRHLMSPTRGGGGGNALAAMGIALGEAELPDEDAQSPEEDAGVGSDDGVGGGGASQEAHGMVSASGRPVRRRKPTAIALAAAAAAEEDEGFGRSGRGSVVAAVAAAVAAAGATHAETTAAGLLAATVPMPDGMGVPVFGGEGGSGGGGSGSGGAMNGHDLLSTEALLAKVPPVRTRGPARGGAGSAGPGSRRAAERVSPAPAFAGGAEDGGAEVTEGGDGEGTEEGVGSQEPLEGAGGAARPARTTSGAAAAAAQQAALQEQAAAAALQQQALAEALAAQQPPPRPAKPLPVRARRRKSLPEKAPPFWEAANVLPPRQQGGADA